MTKSLWKRNTRYENASPERKSISSLDRDKHKLKQTIIKLQEAIKVRNEKIKELKSEIYNQKCLLTTMTKNNYEN